MKKKMIYALPRVNLIPVALERNIAQIFISSPINPKEIKVVDWEKDPNEVESDIYAEF